MHLQQLQRRHKLQTSATISSEILLERAHQDGVSNPGVPAAALPSLHYQGEIPE